MFRLYKYSGFCPYKRTVSYYNIEKFAYNLKAHKPNLATVITNTLIQIIIRPGKTKNIFLVQVFEE